MNADLRAAEIKDLEQELAESENWIELARNKQWAINWHEKVNKRLALVRAEASGLLT